ncbi:MAG: ribose 5-phosphate isomerase B [Candidatus Rokubacteria bacterium]|nr:ribose 5-phosphate isomerase B [Candidatus Rokubacteria bacterium]
MARVAVAADHAGFPHKGRVVRALEQDGHAVTDLGTTSTEPVDYPDYARAVGLAVRDGRADLGVLICGSGAGVSIAANKIRGVRAALCHDLFTARQARQDDDANVLCLGARVVGLDLAITLARAFAGAAFSHAERHEQRLAKVLALEAQELGGRPAPAALTGTRRDVLGEPAVGAALAALVDADAGRRLWARDASLWSADAEVQAAIRTRLGWLDAPAVMRERLAELERFAAAARADGVTDVVLLGMGGSSLAPEVLAVTFGAARGCPSLTVLDTTDPGAIRGALDRLPLERTLVLVASKSGTTTEVDALYRLFRSELSGRSGTPGARFVAITDPGTPLERLAAADGFRHAFLNDPAIGGRFSALSFFGLVPGALLGLDLAALLDDAASMATRCQALTPLADNPGVRLGAILGGFAAAGRDKVTLLLSPPLSAFGAWLEQLLTESTGKQGRGLVVVHGEPPGEPAAYGDDRVFVALALEGDGDLEKAAATLEGAGHPVIRLGLGSRLDLGGEFFRWEFATAVAGVVLGVNPFDEPNVAQAKGATATALEAFRESGRLPEAPASGVEEVARALADAAPGDYVALLAYLTPAPAVTAALQRLRTLLRDRTRLATTVGYGPRYLHSTGQLHKGGPATPILLLFTAREAEDLAIPGEAYGFATLERAQALGDLATLRAARRRAFWLPLVGPPAEALERFTGELMRRVA